MQDFFKFSPIRFLDFYFSFMFMASTYRRFGQYQHIGKLVFASPGRWPNLLQLMNRHRTIFLGWTTLAPALLALVLMVIQLLASRLLWPEAGRQPFGLTLEDVLSNPLALAPITLLGFAMLGMDLYGLIVVGEIPRAQMEKSFDDAEYWLKSRTAHVVRVVTFGRINPRKMVAEEVRKALEQANVLLNSTLWWVNTQVSLRFLFGLSLWLTWAFSS